MPDIWLFLIAAATVTLAPGPEALCILVTLSIFGSIAFFSGIVGAYLQRNASVSINLNRLAGCAFIGLGIRIALPASR